MSRETTPADHYVPPKNALADAIQYPLDERWAGRVLNAYRKSSRPSKPSEHPNDH